MLSALPLGELLVNKARLPSSIKQTQAAAADPNAGNILNEKLDLLSLVYKTDPSGGNRPKHRRRTQLQRPEIYRRGKVLEPTLVNFL